ncbi:MAG TPA: acyltransferase [Xanthobacteraceae bacterium]|nr:acyltransferase [Xanthobacteraceae bacterium]
MIFDFIRSVAALAVLVGHANAIFPQAPDPPAWPQQLGVVVFFLLSGYLISQTLQRRLQRDDSSFTDYAIDRWSRIYSGFFPALVLVVFMDYVATAGGTAGYPETLQRFSIPLFVGNLFMLQAPTVMLPFGSAGPFWTVAIEFWIYMFVGLIAFACRDGLTIPKAVAIVATGVIPVQSLTDNYGLLVAWLLGALVQQLVSLYRPKSSMIAMVIVPLLTAASTGYLIWNIHSNLPVYTRSFYLVAAVTLYAIVVLSESIEFGAIPTAIAAWFASWSYSLYLLHHSILMLIGWGFGGLAKPGWGIAASIVTAIAFASLTENHHKSLARYLKQLVHARWLKPRARTL